MFLSCTFFLLEREEDSVDEATLKIDFLPGLFGITSTAAFNDSWFKN